MDNNYLSVCQQLELSGLLLLENKMGSEQSLLEEVKFLQPLSFSFIERCRPASAFFQFRFSIFGTLFWDTFTKNALQSVLQGISAERTRDLRGRWRSLAHLGVSVSNQQRQAGPRPGFAAFMGTLMRASSQRPVQQKSTAASLRCHSVLR